MLIDSINLIEGSDVKNLILPSGTSFPQNPNPGELFFYTTDSTVYLYQTTSWVALGPGNTGSQTPSALVHVVASLTSIATPEQGDVAFVTTESVLYVYNGTAWTRSVPEVTIPSDNDPAQIYDIALSCPGDVVTASTLVFFVVPRAFTVSTTFVGSKAAIGTSNGDATFTLYKNGSAAATIDFTGGSLTGTFTTVQSSNLSFNVGDIFSIDSPASNAPSNLAISIVATLI